MVKKLILHVNFEHFHFYFLAEIRMTHLDRSYFVTMGTYQMGILLQFNEHKQLTLNEIEEATKLNMKELEKQTISLIDAKFLLGNTVHLIRRNENIELINIFLE
jgi:hypothetical protein